MKKLVKVMILTLTAMMLFAGVSTIKAEAATTTTKTTSKTTKKVTTLKNKAKNSTTKTTSTKVSTKKTVEGQYNVSTKTTVTTTVTTKIAAKKKTVTTVVKTTVATTKEAKATVSTNTAKATSVSNTANFSIRSLEGKASANVIKAFETLGYKITVNSKVSYSGYFSAKDRSVTLRRADASVMLHELGHFVAFVSGNRDRSAEFKSIYNSEAAKYTGPNKAYVTQNESEYFAESYRNFIEDGAKLKAERPATYNYIVASVDKITDSSVATVKAIYY